MTGDRGGGVVALQQIIMAHPQLSLSTTQGLALWAAVRASWVLRCDVWLFIVTQVSITEPHSKTCMPESRILFP